MINIAPFRGRVIEFVIQGYSLNGAYVIYPTLQFSPDLLKDQIDISRVPFSNRGSRLLVFKDPVQNRLFVKLAERLTKVEPGLEAYLHRPPFIRDLYLVDESGNRLDFKVSSYPHALKFETSIGEFGLVFINNQTLGIGLPPGKAAGVHFHVVSQFWRETDAGGELKSVRNLAYRSNGEVICNRIVPEDGGYTVEFVIQASEDCTISILIRDSLELQHDAPPFSLIYRAAEDRWQNWFSRVPAVSAEYRRKYAYAWWVMANNLISPLGNVAYEAMMPSKSSYVGLWLWDSAMHALAFRHIDPELGRNQIRAMLACQLADGMLPDAVYDEGVVSEIDHPIKFEVTKPPILAWAALKLHEADPDLEFLQEIYVPLVRWNAWWFSMNDDDVDGLAQYNHPYSSGLDDNPLWDYGMPVESPDINTYLCVQMGSLAVIAEALGMQSEALMWRRRAASIVRRMIEDFWDADAGLFRALHNEQPIPVLTPFNLYPLWTGQLPAEIQRRLIDHLTNPNEFWGEFAIPSVARNDPHYDPDKMWCGPTWANINYFFIEALDQVGEHNLAEELRQKTLKMIMNQPSIYEYYNAETGRPPEKAVDTFGWTAAVFIDLAIQASNKEVFSNDQ
jgi:putative isomerase